MNTKSQSEIMRDAGYVRATEAAEALGYANVGTVHRKAKRGELVGLQSGKDWYISVHSMLEAFAHLPPIVDRIKALGVRPVPPKEVKRGKSA